jgi:Dipeptidyl aminopeptidases/acylaminoacyl-peptidases
MPNPIPFRTVGWVTALLFMAAAVFAAESPQGRGGFGGSERGVYKARLAPHWFGDNSKFWYRNDLRGGVREFVLVDAVSGKRGPAFDHQRLAAALSSASGSEFKADQLPFTEISFVDFEKALQFEASGKTWRCDLKSYECVATTNSQASIKGVETDAETFIAGTEAEDDFFRAASFDESLPSPQADANRSANRRGQTGGNSSSENRRLSPSRRSPNGKWTATIRDFNVVLRAESGGEEITLTQDGVENNYYGQLEWSPDSKTLVAWRIEPGDRKEVFLVQSSPPGGGRAVMRQRPYSLPGDRFNRYEPSIFDIASRRQSRIEVDRLEHEWERPQWRWSKDGRRFAYQQVDRGHQRLRLIEVDCDSAKARNIIDEKSDTFIWTAHTENLNLRYINWLEKTEEIIYVSEKDGWRHLYLVDVPTGTIRNQITKGEWVVRGIDRIDEEKCEIWFRACGRNADQDPYFIHYYRINFDGSGLVALTEGNGTHSVQFSPDRRFLIDTYSRVDSPPVHELRRALDGTLVVPLEQADITELKETGWEPPEVFVAKGRDGKTDIWGIICRPGNLDPAKKYPVLEQIYAGPQSAYVPKSFSAQRRFSSMTDMGFIVVQMDGMGTAFRSKAFHDVCFKNLKDAGFPDRILWHKAAAEKYPYYDITRVGVYGTSAGGQNAGGAVLFHPEFYKAAAANCGCHDNRMDKASWNEQWMGYPVGRQYAESSNIENASKLGGALFLIVGEMDSNVPPESTLRFVDALIAAGKDFDMLVVPGAEHGTGGRYGSYVQRRTREFFARHLLNVPAGETKTAQTSRN